MTQEELQQAAEKEYKSPLYQPVYISGITSETAKRYWEEAGWISVEDRLPNDREVVIICWVYKGKTMVTSGSYNHLGYWQHGNATQLNVTHWRPLPFLPPNPTK